MNKSYYILPAIITFIIMLPLLLAAWYYQGVNFWQSWIPGVAGTYEEFCERNRMDELIREPSNTFSNLAYVWLGLQVLAFAIWDSKNKTPQNRIQQRPIFSIVFAASLILLGAGSFFYHASLSKIAQRWDMTGVYAIMSFLLIYPISHLLPNKQKFISISVFIILLMDVLLYAFKWSLNGIIFLPLFIGAVLLGIIIEQMIRKPKRKTIWGFISFASLIAAGIVWYLDREKILCDPDSLIQGHAAWHCLTGWSTFSIYLFFRSERLTNH